MSISIYEIAPRPANEARREQAVVRSAALTALDRADLHAMVDRASALCGTPMSVISIVFRDWQYLIAAKGMETGVHQRSTSFCGHAIMTPGDLFVVPDATRDVRFAGNPAVVDEPGLRFYAGAPLLDPQGLPLGVVCVLDQEPRAALTDEQTAGLTALAREIVALLYRLAVIPDTPDPIRATA